MNRQSHTPDNISILPRARRHELAELLARDWFDQHPFKTAWFNSMSITFPLGEKFFIDSVRNFAAQIEDPKLQQEIRGFCGQEGHHRSEHDRYNRALCSSRGYDLEYLEGRLARKLAFVEKHFSPLQRLSDTAALEHITAIMAESALSPDAPMMDMVPEPMRELWDWHAAEEMEHKAVAFDVFRAVGGTERMRKRSLRFATLYLMFDILVGVVHMLRRDRMMWKLSVWTEGWRFLFARGGILRRIWPAYREYFRDGFHPWQRDTRPLLEQWKQQQAA